MHARIAAWRRVGVAIAFAPLGLAAACADAASAAPLPACDGEPVAIGLDPTMRLEGDAAALRGRRVWLDVAVVEPEGPLHLSSAAAVDAGPSIGREDWITQGWVDVAPGATGRLTATVFVPHDAQRVAFGLQAPGAPPARGLAVRLRCGERTWRDGEASPKDALLEEALDTYLGHALAAPVDGAPVRREARALATGAENDEDVAWALVATMRRLGDRHSYAIAPGPSLASAHAAMAPAPPRAWMRPDGIAVVAVSQAGFSDARDGVAFARTLHEAVSQVASAATSAWVVDLRGMTGGDSWVLLAGLSSLLNGERVGGVVGRGWHAEWRIGPGRAGEVGSGWAVDLGIADEAVFTGPLAVLVGPRTGSAGEAVAVAFAGRPRTRSFGQPSAGFTTGVRPSWLAGGMLLGVADSRYADRSGRTVDGPLVPDEPVEATVDPLERAAAWLHAQPAAHGTVK